MAAESISRAQAHEKPANRVCYYCSTPFYRKSSKGRDAGICCSRECGFAWQRAKDQRPPSFSILKAVCAGCGSRFQSTHGATKYCGHGCSYAAQKEKMAAFNAAQYQPKRFACGECGKDHITQHGKPASVYCSTTCGRRHAKRIGRKVGKARKRGATTEPVDPMKVFARDGWRCHLCGVKTPIRLRGTYDDRAPELDHIVPLAKGGDHSYRNTACSCRKCNGLKADTIKGQMLLFG